MAHLITTQGKLAEDQLGLILPHEHIYVDMQALERPKAFSVSLADVITLMGPEVEKAMAVGVTALVDCTPEGVGRRCDLVRAVSAHTRFPIVVPTGIYREPWIPQWARDASEDNLTAWMVGELRNEIDGCGVQAGWIKLGASDDALSVCEKKILRAAARAGVETHAVIGSHTVSGRIALQQMDIIEAAGYSAKHFIWIHAQQESDWALHIDAAQRGAWIEYDAIGSEPADAVYIDRITAALDAGFGDQLLLSHDRGWFDPAQPGGGTPRNFTYISTIFLPKLLAAGILPEVVRTLTQVNPFRAFAR